jgi:hypothetical protein
MNHKSHSSLQITLPLNKAQELHQKHKDSGNHTRYRKKGKQGMMIQIDIG